MGKRRGKGGKGRREKGERGEEREGEGRGGRLELELLYNVGNMPPL